MNSYCNPLVHIIILNWNGKEDTRECLHSVSRIDYDNLVTVVVDNGSTDGSEAEIKAAFPAVTFIQTGENLGYAEGNNVGIRHAMESGASYVFVLNNDTTVDPAVLSALVREAERHPKAAILGPKIYFYDKPDVINSAGGSINYDTLQRGHIGYGVKDDGTAHTALSTLEWTTGCAMLLRVSALRETGLFDPDFFLICEELDLCYRTRKRGYDILFVPDAKLWHKVSAAFNGNYSPIYCYYMYRNILLYVRKNISSGRRFDLYRQLVKESHQFYIRLKEQGDRDYRSKGMCILLGTLHFFFGRYGKAPSWIFRLKLPGKLLPEREPCGDIFKAKIQLESKLIQGNAGASISIPVTIINRSEMVWLAFSSRPVRLSYHIYDEDGKTVSWDGTRTVLPCNVKAGKRVTLHAIIDLPPTCGSYCLEWDLVQEAVAWFSAKGSETSQCKLTVY